jgi:hypothetical protein
MRNELKIGKEADDGEVTPVPATIDLGEGKGYLPILPLTSIWWRNLLARNDVLSTRPWRHIC